MAVEDIQARARVAQARLDAQLGAIDAPEAPVMRVLGFRLKPGLRMMDQVSGEPVEVVDAGVIYVSESGAAVKSAEVVSNGQQ